MGLYVFISVLILVVCVLLILVVLVQNSKGGGLASNFSSSNQIMGVRKTADFLEKATWTLAVSLLVLSLVSIFVIPRSTGKKVQGTELQEQIEKNAVPAANNYQAPPEKK
ncbi:MAG: preprotein translocase subunit SecG [Bacteroidetes bacterium]|nr:preprotein translocase subunit SecG [Bacteroidota bacterium]